MSRWRRRFKLFVARGFQIRYISLILVFMFAIVALTGYTVYVTTWVMLGEKLAAVYPQGLLFDIAKKVNMVLLVRLAIVTPLVAFIGLVLSNRIAGPIYRIQRYMKRAVAGNYENELRLRKNDELQDVAASINEFMNKMKREQNRRYANIDILKKRIDELESAEASGTATKEAMLEKIISIRKDLDKLKES